MSFNTGLYSGLCLLCLAALPAQVLAGDADGGHARAYFGDIETTPLTFAPAVSKKSNIVWIVVDALRPDHLGAYGYKKPTTPFLDSLAKESYVFLNAYSNAPWTRPATASMLTGLFPSAHRVQSDRSKLDKSIPTIAQQLKKLGYKTAAVIGNGNASRVANLHYGFDDYIDTTTHWDGLPTAADVYGEATDWLLKKRPQNQPWFLFVFLVDPHDPYHAPDEYEKAWLGDYQGEPRRRAHWEYKNKYAEREIRSMVALYDAAIRYSDDQTKLFFQSLKQMKCYDNTSFIVTADHGEAFGEHGYFLHSYHHHEEFIRVPLIIRSPAWRGSGHVFALAQLVDLAPTVLALAGGNPSPTAPGRDLALILAEPVNPSRVVLSEYNEFGIRRSAIADLHYKVILQLPADRSEFRARKLRPELLPSVSFDKEIVQVYDRRKDPLEKNPLPLKSIPPQAQRLVDGLREYMLATPRANQDVDLNSLPKSVVEDLRNLGYIQ